MSRKISDKMIKYVARKKFLCGYRCQHCGKYNIEEGFIGGTFDQSSKIEQDFAARYNELTDVDERRRVDSQLEIEAEKKYRQLCLAVNERKQLSELYTENGGICKECISEQAWSDPPKISKLEQFFSDLLILSSAEGGGCIFAMIVNIPIVLLMDSKFSRWNKRVQAELEAIEDKDCFPRICSREDALETTDEELKPLVSEWKRIDKEYAELKSRLG